MNNKFILLVVAIILFSFLAGADSYSLLQSGNTFTYYFDSSNSSVPFLNFDPMDICMKILEKSPVENGIKIYPTLKIATRELYCQDQFLYRFINYIIYNKDNITILHDFNFASSNRNSILGFASLFNITALSYPNSQAKGKIVYLGNYDAFSEKVDNASLNSGESVFYIKDSKDYVAIVGKSSDETLNSLNTLIKIYNETFAGNDCIILTGCGDNISSVSSSKDVVASISKWKNLEISVKQVIESIKNWLVY